MMIPLVRAVVVGSNLAGWLLDRRGSRLVILGGTLVGALASSRRGQPPMVSDDLPLPGRPGGIHGRPGLGAEEQGTGAAGRLRISSSEEDMRKDCRISFKKETKKEIKKEPKKG
ncbi:MAG: MFS transporter [Methanosarcinales archaeon]|nr:MFS transporter [Methanosarcinales archaeon]